MADGAFDYYWMADLAELAEDLGRRDEALACVARAWRAAKGPATRVQWGSRYVDGLVRLDPGDSATIGTTLTAMFDEMDTEPEVLRGRNRSALVAALAMMSMGVSATRAIEQIRQRRVCLYGHTPLSNVYFEAWLLEIGRKVAP